MQHDYVHAKSEVHKESGITPVFAMLEIGYQLSKVLVVNKFSKRKSAKKEGAIKMTHAWISMHHTEKPKDLNVCFFSASPSAARILCVNAAFVIRRVNEALNL